MSCDESWPDQDVSGKRQENPHGQRHLDGPKAGREADYRCPNGTTEATRGGAKAALLRLSSIAVRTSTNAGDPVGSAEKTTI